MTFEIPPQRASGGAPMAHPGSALLTLAHFALTSCTLNPNPQPQNPQTINTGGVADSSAGRGGGARLRFGRGTPKPEPPSPKPQTEAAWKQPALKGKESLVSQCAGGDQTACTALAKVCRKPSFHSQLLGLVISAYLLRGIPRPVNHARTSWFPRNPKPFLKSLRGPGRVHGPG